MKSLIINLALLAVAYCRPDGSELPSGSYLPTNEGKIDIDPRIALNGGISSSGISDNFGGSAGVSNFGSNRQMQDQKHVYFYAAPDEEQASRFRINIAPSSQRNTKIIFVKAPSYGGIVPEVIAPPSSSEDKTLVYVLVKKSEQGGQITIPAGAGVKQTKPEVFFIKYNTQHDAQQHIQNGLQGQAVGFNIPDLGNEANFVRTLESSLKTSGGYAQIHGSTGSGISINTAGGGGAHGPAGISGPY